MRESRVGDDSISECTHCRGLWFDKGGLEAVKDEVMPDMGWLDIDGWRKTSDLSVSLHVLNCPACRINRLTLVEDRSSMTQIGLCTQCKGTWLATGQFLNLINALLDEAYQKTVPEYSRITLQKARELVMNPDAIVSEWQDLKTVVKLLRHRIFVEHPRLKSVLEGLQKSLPL